MTTRNNRAVVGICTLTLYLPDALTLKDKRSTVKSICRRVRNTHNAAIAEIDRMDNRQHAVLAFTVVSNQHHQTERMLDSIVRWIESQFPEAQITDEDIEIV